jgi:hypothetical protein
MTGAPETPDFTLDDVVALVRELPSRLRSIRVETHGWSDVGLSRLASDRVRGLLARQVPRSPDAPVGAIERQSVVSWMVFSEGSWNRPMFDVLPERWREELERTSPGGAVRRFVQAHDEDTYWWDQGHGPRATDRNTQTSLFAAWVVGTRWTTTPAEFEVRGASSVMGRSGVRVCITPQPGVRWSAGPFGAGDAHEFVVDLATGMTLSVTSLVDGSPFQHHEVVDFELGADVGPELTAVPAGAEAIPVSRGFRAPEDVATAAQFAVLAPTWLPANFTFQTGSARDDDDVLHASLIFSRDRREFVTLSQQPESQVVGEEVYEWQRVERGPRAVLITDLGDEPGERIAHTTFGGTMAVIYASLPAPDLLELAFSLEIIHA